MEVGRGKPVAEEPGMVVALGNNKNIVLQILVHHIPGLVGGPPHPAYPQTLALSQGVKKDARMFTDSRSFRGPDFPATGGDILSKEFTEGPFADEADTGAVLFIMGNESVLFRQGAYPGLGQFPQGEKRSGELLLVQPAQEIGLVLVYIDTSL